MTFEHLLVPLDFGPASDRAADLAVAIASKFGSKLDLFHAFYISPIVYGSGTLAHIPYDDLTRDAQKALHAALARVKERYPSVQSVLADGDPRQRIVEVAALSGADLIVMGTHGRRGLSRAFLGSVAERVVRTSPVPLLTTGPTELAKGDSAFRHVLVPTDFSEPAERAVETAAALAKAFDARLLLVHAYLLPRTIYDARTLWPPAEIKRAAEIALDRALATTREQFAAAESVLVPGDPRDGILEVARERSADLIVMGTHGRRGLSRAFLGSVASSVVRASPIPVLTIGAHPNPTVRD